MNKHEFCDHCEGCRPALMGANGVIPDDCPVMIAVNNIWNNQTTYAERKAFIDITVHNRVSEENYTLARPFFTKLSELKL